MGSLAKLANICTPKNLPKIPSGYILFLPNSWKNWDWPRWFLGDGCLTYYIENAIPWIYTHSILKRFTRRGLADGHTLEYYHNALRVVVHMPLPLPGENHNKISMRIYAHLCIKIYFLIIWYVVTTVTVVRDECAIILSARVTGVPIYYNVYIR